MLHTWVTEDVIVIATGFIFLSLLTILSTIVMLESRESLRKKKCTEVVKEFLLEKHDKVPLMQQCNKNVENGVENIQSVNRSLVLLMPRPSAPSAL